MTGKEQINPKAKFAQKRPLHVRSTNFTREASNRPSWAFNAILRGIKNNLPNRKYRNETYESFSREYHTALKEGRYEEAVMCLMLMKMICRHEKDEKSERTIAEIVLKIIAERFF